MIIDSQKQSRESSTSNTTTTRRPSKEPQPDNGEIKSREQEKDSKEDKSDHREKSENVSPKLRCRERDSPRRGSSRRENERRRDRVPRDRSVQKSRGNGVSRRGRHGSRPGPRRESGSNVPVSSLLGYPAALPPMFSPGDGLLPVHVSGLSQLQAALQAKIQTAQTEMQTTVLQMLTNPPPVPGEHVPEYDQRRQQPPTRHGPYGPRDSKRLNERHPPKRPQSSVPDTKDISLLMPEHVKHEKEHATRQVEVPSHRRTEPSGDLPKWLQRTKKTVSESNDQQLGIEANATRCHQENTVIKTNKRKSPFHGDEMQHEGKVVIATSPEGLPQPGPARVQKVHPKGYCFQQLDTGRCTAKSCKYSHLPHAKLLEVRFLGDRP